MVDGIVLAAGFSSRAKTNKMTLEYKGKPLITHVIETISLVCDRVIVVTGHYRDEIELLIKNRSDVVLVHNDNYAQGMFTSIQKGVYATENDFFIVPGDYPLIKPNTYQSLMAAKGKIRVPSFDNRLGHPIFFDKHFKDLILNTSCTNLKAFRNEHPFTIIEVDDPGILIDIDNMEDYNTLIGKD